MRATLMRSALALSLVLVSVSACSGSVGEQASAALKKYFRAYMEDFAATSLWEKRNYQYQFDENSPTASAIFTAELFDGQTVKIVCNYKLTDTSWSRVDGSYYENDLLVTDQWAPCGGPFPRE